jgi:F420-non-reducing hydrogenase large subunit
MTRSLQINPVTRIEGHAKVDLEIGDDGRVSAACMHVLEFRGFEKFVQGVQVELMPTLTSRICGTCPHSHHLVAAKCLDRVFSVEPPRAASLLRELLNCGSTIHSHAVHFFVLAGPDLMMGLNADPAKRNIVGLLEVAPELAKKALKLRSLGTRIVEIVGGRATHPVTAVAGGVAKALTAASRESLKHIAAEALELAKEAMEAGKQALAKNTDVIATLPLSVANVGTVRDGALDMYDGKIAVRRPDASVACEMESSDYRKWFYEEALPFTYSKPIWFRDPQGKPTAIRVGPLARLNCAKKMSTPLADAELQAFKSTWGDPCDMTVMNHHARLIELLNAAELAVRLVADDEIASSNTCTQVTATPKPGIAHIEAPRGVLIHDYDVDANGIVRAANFLVATQFNISSINATVKDAANKFVDKSEAELLNSVEFGIRCWDPCLSCSTHFLGKMPLDVRITQNGKLVRAVRR